MIIVLKTARAHHYLTKILLPLVDDRVIVRVNTMLDNPKATDRILENARQAWLRDFGKVPGLSYKAHRKFNHTIPVALLVGAMEGGFEGAEVALAHLGLDRIKDEMVRSMGADVANAIEKYFIA